jgi:NADH:ubiquinone oxidoreductase subunit E
MKENPAPHSAYILVCTHDDCAARGSEKLLKRLKRVVDAKGLKKDIRVLACGCLGQCGEGPNVVVEPGHMWCCGARKGDVDKIVAAAVGMAGSPGRVKEGE